MEQIQTTFAKLNISYEPVTHESCSTLQEWTQTLRQKSHCSGKNTGFLKSLLLKPKGGQDKLIFVLALDTTEINIAALVKSFGFKEARVATDDLIATTLNVEKVNCSLIFLLITISDAICFESHV